MKSFFNFLLISLIFMLSSCIERQPFSNLIMDKHDIAIENNNVRQITEKFILTDSITTDSLNKTFRIDSTFVFIYKQPLSKNIILTGKDVVTRELYDKLDIDESYKKGNTTLLQPWSANYTHNFTLSNETPFYVVDKYFNGCGGYSGNFCQDYYDFDDHYCDTKFYVIVGWHEPALDIIVERVFTVSSSVYNSAEPNMMLVGLPTE